MPTLTPTRVPPTKTPKPTETPRPVAVIFERDFNTGQLDLVKGSKDHWNFLHQDGARVEIVSDPTGSVDASGRPRGKVMRATIQGQSVQHLDWGSDRWWRNGYPDWTYGYPVQLVRAPCAIQVDVYKPRDLYGIGLLSVHRLNRKTGERISCAGFEVYRGSLVLLARDGKGNDRRVDLKEGLFQSDQWMTLRLDFLLDGRVMPYVNGQLAYAHEGDTLSVPVDDEYEAGFEDGHAGLIFATEGPTDSFKQGQWLLNDNFMIMEYR
jgi:hypothetical protein